MTAEPQSIPAGSLQSEHDQLPETVQPTGARKVTCAQLRLAKFIFEREVAASADVVEAIEKGNYKQVDAWKAEAHQKGPRIREWSFPKFTRTSFGSTKELASSSEGVIRENESTRSERE